MVHLVSKEKKPASVRVEVYSSHGCPIDQSEKTVPPGESAEVRLDLTKVAPGYGWIRVATPGKAIGVNQTWEVLKGNKLTTSPSPNLPGTRDPQFRLITLFGRPGPDHRWELDVTRDNRVLQFFVNLSDHPVQLGICAADKTNFFCRTLGTTVNPMAQVFFRLQRSHKYVIIQSSAGYSVSMGMNFGGNTQTFDASSSISFGESSPTEEPK